MSIFRKAGSSSSVAKKDRTSSSYPEGFVHPHSLACAGDATIPKEKLVAHSWRHVNGSVFKTRVGPNYKKYGKKAASGPALFEMVDVQMWGGATNAVHFAASGPPLPFDIAPTADQVHNGVPRLLIVTFQLPVNKPDMMNNPTSGPSRNLVWIMKPSDALLEQCRDLSAASPAVRHTIQWLNEAQGNPDLKGRLKMICQSDDLKEIGVPSMLHKYSGKPVLITKSSNIIHGDGYVQIDINVHTWAYLTLKGFNSMVDLVPRMIADVGLVIEGRNDEQLPEQMLCCGTFSKLSISNLPDYSTAKSVTAAMQEMNI